MNDISLIYRCFVLLNQINEMTKTVLTILSLVLFLIPEAHPQKLSTYKFKSGIIKYKTVGRNSKTEIIYFDNYGKVLLDETTTILLQGETKKTKSLLKNDTIFELQGNTIIHQTKYKETAQGIHKLISGETISAMGYKLSGSELVAGCECDKYVGENGKLWVWNDIILKSEIEIMGIKIITEATEIIIGIKIDAAKFEI